MEKDIQNYSPTVMFCGTPCIKKGDPYHIFSDKRSKVKNWKIVHASRVNSFNCRVSSGRKIRKNMQLCLRISQTFANQQILLGICPKLIPRKFCIFALNRLSRILQKKRKLTCFFFLLKDARNLWGTNICAHNAKFMRKDFSIPLETLVDCLFKFRIYCKYEEV